MIQTLRKTPILAKCGLYARKRKFSNNKDLQEKTPKRAPQIRKSL